ncbi:MAG TPA: microviridin/marinostatin family tricyclic proteinase inhibitor [Chitinophagaceae bacterium]|nr:microviridin/marinostatin family tricyclic proteinase inhibitor [Chitinophagaceae bacterium]
MKQNEQAKQPFFAQFLDAQKAKSNDPQHHLGTHPFRDGDQTMKYPSDNDENPPTE